MFYGDTIADTRPFFYQSWEKYLQKQVLLPLEQQIVDVILLHPEYHSILSKKEVDRETTLFLHLGLHLAIRDQIATDKPKGILRIYQTLLQHHPDTHQAEHQLMETLEAYLWQAQQTGIAPDERLYLQACERLVR